jgi:protein gp37
MGVKSTIEWTESTWNPVTGCTEFSLGCKNCYAARMAVRLRAMGQPNYATGFDLALHEHTLALPLQWKTPQIIFVNSMSDLFHEDVPLTFIKKVFSVMNRADWHQYQILTKRSERLLKLDRHLQWANHIWMGVSVETEKYVQRIEDLRKTRAHIKFLSLEPFLGPINKLKLTGIDWVIVGGESGPGARPMLENWVIDVRNQCGKSKVPFFFKQWGGVNKKKAGRLLQGRTWDAMPITHEGKNR